MNFFRNFHFDRSSFWLGFFGGVLFWWLVSRIVASLPRIRKFIRKTFQEARASLNTSTEVRLSNDTLKYTQSLHLAAPLFSLDEIVVAPRLMAPPVVRDPEDDSLYVDPVARLIPYMPDWPELASKYGAPTITLVQGLQEGANLLLIGQPGSGKTTALCYLASLLIRKDETVGTLANLVPIFVHAVDIENKTQVEMVKQSLTNAVALHASTLTLPRLPNLMTEILEGGRMLLLLDGVDELSQEEVQNTHAFLAALLIQFPTIRVVVAASDNYFGKINTLGLIPVAIAAWNDRDRTAFIEKWSQLWGEYIAPDTTAQTDFVDNLLLSAWLLSTDNSLTPFEFTLKTWSAFAGDILGSDIPSSIEAYVRRMTAAEPDSRQPLERLAAYMVREQKPVLPQKETDRILPQVSPVTETPVPANEIQTISEVEFDEQAEPSEVLVENEAVKKSASREISTRSILPNLVSNGLLSPHLQDTISFNHLIILGYLAAWGLCDTPDEIQVVADQPRWAGSLLTLEFLACFQDVTSNVQSLLKQDDFLSSNIFQLARWLRVAPKQLSWRGAVLRSLANLLQKEYLTASLCARAMTALALSGDPAVQTLFRQIIKSEHENHRIFGALGLGMVGDGKVLNEVTTLCEDDLPAISLAACLSLVTIGGKHAIDTLATFLLQGSETAQCAAAQAFANDPGQGYLALEDGATIDDLMVRRAVVYGLERIDQPWAIELLEKIQMEDGQWVVRNAASQALENLRQPLPYIPKPLPELSESAWLISFAGKLGEGVVPGQPAMELVYKATREGSILEKLHALDYIRLQGSDESMNNLYDVYFRSEGLVHDAAYDAIWHTAHSGVKLPHPKQFGLGEL